jgi:hypothetical protein
MARGIVLPSPNSVLALAGIMRCSAHSRGHQSFQSGRTEPVASLTELDGIGLFRWEVLDLAKAGFPEHAGDLIGREERGEVDIAGCEKRLFRLGLGSGHYETENDFRPGRTTRGPAKGVADRGWRQARRRLACSYYQSIIPRTALLRAGRKSIGRRNSPVRLQQFRLNQSLRKLRPCALRECSEEGRPASEGASSERKVRASDVGALRFHVDYLL